MLTYYLESVSIKLVSIRDIRNPNCAQSTTYYSFSHLVKVAIILKVAII